MKTIAGIWQKICTIPCRKRWKPKLWIARPKKCFLSATPSNPGSQDGKMRKIGGRFSKPLPTIIVFSPRCATCVDDASPGESGFCPKRRRKQSALVNKLGRNWEEMEYGRPTTTEHWGVCSIQCLPRTSVPTATSLQVNVSTLMTRTAGALQ